MIGWLNDINRLVSAGCPGITRLLVGNAGGGGSVGGVANMAGWCWCWVCDLREKCEVARLEMDRGRAGPEEWCGGIWGDRGRCFGRLMLVALLALLLRLILLSPLWATW